MSEGQTGLESAVREQRLNLERDLLSKIAEEVNENNPDPKKIEGYKAVYREVAGIGFHSDEKLTRHERALDWWRVIITLALIGVLAVAVILVVRQTKPSATAAAYISLISGLAGIALGWMFASAGDLKERKRST